MPYLKSRELLTEEQRQILKEIPSDLSAKEMAAYYSFSQNDIEVINRHRRLRSLNEPTNLNVPSRTDLKGL